MFFPLVIVGKSKRTAITYPSEYSFHLKSTQFQSLQKVSFLLKRFTNGSKALAQCEILIDKLLHFRFNVKAAKNTNLPISEDCIYLQSENPKPDQQVSNTTSTTTTTTTTSSSSSSSSFSLDWNSFPPNSTPFMQTSSPADPPLNDIELEEPNFQWAWFPPVTFLDPNYLQTSYPVHVTLTSKERLQQQMMTFEIQYDDADEPYCNVAIFDEAKYQVNKYAKTANFFIPLPTFVRNNTYGNFQAQVQCKFDENEFDPRIQTFQWTYCFPMSYYTTVKTPNSFSSETQSKIQKVSTTPMSHDQDSQIAWTYHSVSTMPVSQENDSQIARWLNDSSLFLKPLSDGSH